MEISINGKPADIILEKEKKVGDILSSLEQWLDGSGNRLSGLFIDGIKTGVTTLTEAMERELVGIQNLDIRISSWDELAMEALGDLKETCIVYSDAAFDLRMEIRMRWEESAAAAFISTEIKDLHELIGLSFGGEGLSTRDLEALVEERLRELAEPKAEIHNMEKPISEIVRRLEGLPLDVQTGKDGRAAETIQLFSRMGEKLFRLLQVFKYRGLLFESLLIDGLAVKGFLNDFSTALEELCAAYRNQDTVLIGDLAEYELAPRLLKLFSALKNFSLEEAGKTL
jgi:hypothetical protein